MEMFVESCPYECSACSTRVTLHPDADVLVLVHGTGGRVEQVVTIDDLERHRYPFPASSSAVEIRLP
jgi:hypothetical protein